MGKFVEIRSYSIEPGSRERFHQVVQTLLIPFLEQRGIDVVAYRPSPHDDCSYYVIRAYDSLAHRSESQDAMYASDAWKDGPREDILSFIDYYTSVVIEMDEATVQALRTTA